MIQIRNAQPTDVTIAAQLLWDTCGEFGDAFFGLGDHRRALQALAWFFVRPNNRLGYHLARLAEVDGAVAGLLLSFPSRDQWRLQAPMAGLFMQFYGLVDGLRLLWNSSPLWFQNEMGSGEYYIAHLAVADGHRGQGIGQTLLLEAENLARQSSLSRCSLLVELDNPNARRLYARMGYETVETHHAGQREFRTLGTPGHERMVKKLD